jgi:choline kinase
MKAVILAAGLGTRLRPITNEVPKCMVPVNGIRIIDKQIDNLLSNNVEEIYVVDGYKADVLAKHLKENYPQVHIVSNPRYSETNNMYSLYLTSEYVKGGEFLLMNADVYYDSNIISGMLQDEGMSKIACDRSQYLEESMKITLDGDRINHISKKISEADHYAVSIDVYRISAEDSTILFKEVEETIEERKDENSWTEVALDNIFNKTNFKPYVIEGRWFEIDNHDDLHKAEEIFKGDKLCKI